MPLHLRIQPALTWIHRVVEVPPFVHPDLGNPCRVLVDDFCDTTGERIRRLISEDVADVRTGRDFEQTPALPNLADGETKQ